MNSIRPCPRCGRQIVSSVAFCPACGEKMVASANGHGVKLLLGAVAVFVALLWIIAISTQTQRSPAQLPTSQAQSLASTSLPPTASVAQTLELTSAQHLSEAKRALADGYKPNKDPKKTTWGEVAAARWHLRSIAQSAPEYREAQGLLKEVARRERLELATKSAVETPPASASTDEGVIDAGEPSSAATNVTPPSSAKQPAQSRTVDNPSQASVTGGSSSDDYYTNAYGARVRRPSFSNSGPPAGATAQCRDGSYSFSQSRRGTCSHHGGVSRWL